MTSKILRSDNTAIANIKSVRFVEKVNATTDLRPGCVSSAYIEVVVYGAQSTAPSSGEPLKYYQVDANNRETYIGTFYAEPSIQSRNTYAFVAFDIVSKLDVDYSERLLAIQSTFPMQLGNLVADACSVAGVTLYTQNFPLHDLQVQAFYADGLTCRDIVAYAAEIACRYVRCDSNENLRFVWYAEKTGYRIYPTSQDTQSETRIAYKQNGLAYKAYSVANVGGVAVNPIDTENAAYLYPSNASSNILAISNNILLTNASSSDMNTIAEYIYTEMAALPVYRPATAHLFPSENPFRAGDIVAVTDAQGVSFSMPIMSLTVEQSAATAEATGNESYETEYGSDAAKQLANLSNSIVQIDKLKVGYAEIDTAVIDSLQANGINADWIDTGALTVKDANDNVIFEADQDNNTVTIAGWSADKDFLSSQGSWMPLKLGDGTIVFGTRTKIDALLLARQIDGTTYNGNALIVGIHPSDQNFVGQLLISDVDGNNEYYLLDVDSSSSPFSATHTLKGNVAIGSNGTNYGFTLNGVNVKNKVNQIGNLTQLSTTNKTDLVSAINELYTMITS